MEAWLEQYNRNLDLFIFGEQLDQNWDIRECEVLIRKLKFIKIPIISSFAFGALNVLGGNR